MALSSNLIALFISFIVLHFLTTAATNPPYYGNSADHILLDCGSSSNSTSSFDGRHWQNDAQPSYLPLNSKMKSLISDVSGPYYNATPNVPYRSARIFSDEFTYSFSELSPGHKFLRLYFLPATYNPSFDTTSYFFSVLANKHTLLSNFSAFLTVSSIKPSSDTLIKEYILHIYDTHQQLDITFLPNSDSYAFINGIEIVSIPNDLYFKGDNIPLQTNTKYPYYLKNDKTLETLFRLNVGGDFVTATGDSGMFRTWIGDDDFVGFETSFTPSRKNVEVKYTLSDPEYTAPEVVYTSARIMNENYSTFYNMTWVFPVDSGFYYLLRLHFCEFFLEITKPGQRIFSIFIENQLVVLDADVISWGNGPQTAVSRDYVVYVGKKDGKETQQDLFLEMKPVSSEIDSYFDNALLNGLEIFKITQYSPNPDLKPVTVTTSGQPTSRNNNKRKSWKLIVGVVGGVALVVAAMAAFLGFLIFRRRMKVTNSDREKSRSTKSSISGDGSLLPSALCRQLSLEEITKATSNFDDNFMIGVGGFGNVYKGYVDNGITEVAIKRLNPSSNQGIREFQAEIKMLSKLRHLHLVSLIGYCNEKGEMILVYDYMSRGTLRDHLYKTKNPHLPWKQRLQICVAVARGLHYLHTGSGHTIIHRDIKSTNILLDENWVAKVSDFGLSKVGPISGSKHHVSTMVKGSFGYLDPEYFLTQRLTDKSDVYSFGVVLLEVLCALPAITRDHSGEPINLVDWAHLFNKDAKLEQIIDPMLKGEIGANCLSKYIEITFKCLNRKGAYRPAMPDVVWNLEFALQLQEEEDERSLSLKLTEEFEAGPSVPIDHEGMVEPDNSYSGTTNYSVTSQSC